MRRRKLRLDIQIKGSLIQVPHLVFFHAYKLMTWVNISVRRNGNILIAAAAAPQPLDGAGTLIQVDHEVEEVEPLPLLLCLQDPACQPLIFAENIRQLPFGQSIGLCRITDHRLHGNLVKACIIQAEHIIGEIQIVLGKGAPHAGRILS